MSVLLTLAFICHLLGFITMIGFGLVYLLRRQFLPYHGVALGRDWDEVPKEVQVLILALMRAVSGSTLGLVIIGTTVLWIPFRSGALWALVAVPVSGFVASAGALYAMHLVANNTPAKPPRLPVLVGLAMGITGLVLSLLPGAV